MAAAAVASATTIEADAFETYRELLALLDERGYPGLQRVWNYVPRINEDQRGVERYKHFNVGRARGFEERFGETAERHFSAASAVGTVGDTLIVCFAAGREPGTHLENPRQISAHRYLPDYGPRSRLLRPRYLRAGELGAGALPVGHGERRRPRDEAPRRPARPT